MVDIGRMAEHSRACMTDVVVFQFEQSLITLRRHILSEIERRGRAATHPTVDMPSSADAPRLEHLEHLLQAAARAQIATSPAACKDVLRQARELLAASLGLSDSTSASYARQLIRMLSQVRLAHSCHTSVAYASPLTSRA